MGEKLYDISQIHLKGVDFLLEMNDGSAASRKRKYIHIQNERFRLALSDENFVQMGIAICAAAEKIKEYKHL